MKKILVVEDNTRNMKLLRDVLQASGYQTLAASTGSEALELATGAEIGLVLMDIQLPDISGVEVLRRLRARPETATVPVVAVSASAMPDARENIMASGFAEYITKPIAIRGLLDTVRSYMEAQDHHR